MATLYDADGTAYEVDDALLADPGDPPQTTDGPRTNADFAALRRQTQATKKAEQDAANARRETAFLRAGIDPEAKEGMAPYFVTGYKGDLTTEAIRAAAQAAGILQAPPPTPEQVAQQEANAQALGAAGRIANAAASAMAAPSNDLALRQAMDDAYKAGGIEALTAVLQAQGIPRVTM